MHPSVERRAEPSVRMAFDAVVELRHADFPAPFPAGATNLGRHGIALEAPFLPQVGTHLACRFPLPGRNELVTVTGEVVWTASRDDEPGRFGLRFAELSREVEAALEEAFPSSPANDVTPVDASPDDDPLGPEIDADEPVQIALEGVADPLTVLPVHQSEDGLVVEQPLPFLSLGRRAVVDGIPRTAILDAVDLVQGGDFPRLVLSLAWEDRVSAPRGSAPTVADREPPPVDLSLADQDVRFVSDEGRPPARAPGAAYAVVDGDADGDDDHLEAGGLDGDATLRDHGPPPGAVGGGPPPHRPRLPRAFQGDAVRQAQSPSDAWATPAPPPLRTPSAGPRRLVRAPMPTPLAGGEPPLVGVDDLGGGAWPPGAPLARGRALLQDLGARLDRGLRGVLPVVFRCHREVLRWARRLYRTVAAAAMRGRAGAAPRTLSGGSLEEGAPRNARLRRRPAGPIDADLDAGAPDGAGELEASQGVVRLVLVAAAAFAVAAAVFVLFGGGGDGGAASSELGADEGLRADPGSGIESPYAPSRTDLAGGDGALGDPVDADGAPPPETVPADSPYAVDLDALDDDGHVPGVPEPFGAEHVPGGQSFLLRMSQPVRSLEGRAEDHGFSVTMRGTLAKDRAGPIAAAHDLVDRAMILNRGSYSVLTVRFVDGKEPPYRVVARNASIEVIIGR